MSQFRTVRPLGVLALALVLAAFAPGCGGGSSGAGPDGAGQGLVLVDFLQAGVDNLPVNTQLAFTFSEPVDPLTVTPGSIQIREGPDFGETADGAFVVSGGKVFFRPVLPIDCALTTGGFKAGTTYRVSVVGSPEEFCVKNSKGQPLEATSTYEFTTLPDTDQDVLQDQIPGAPPAIIGSSPSSHDAAVAIAQGNEITVDFSENLDPCSIDTSTVVLKVYEVGDKDTFQTTPSGRASGFVPVTDQDPSDPYSWGASNSTTVDPAQTIPAAIELQQTFSATRLVVRPLFGRYPDNSLVVLQLTFGIRDFGGSSLTPAVIKFTTENLPTQQGSLTVEFDATTPVDKSQSTADVNSVRAPSRVQGFLLFAGDGDNGGSTLTSNLTPAYPRAVGDCTYRTNSGTKTTFEPTLDVSLDTGSTRNTLCTNTTDGSYAVVWEFATFKIRSGVVVRIVGKNPAILLVQGDVTIENGGVLRTRGDGAGGTPQGNGANGQGYNYPTYPSSSKGGVGLAGAGDGGLAHAGYIDSRRDGEDGWVGYGSPDYNTPAQQGGLGAGKGQPGATNSNYQGGCALAGGGGGHGQPGAAGGNFQATSQTWDGPVKGQGGGVYPEGANATKMYKPSAGSGGGGGGENFYSYYGYYEAPGGGGGAGGGFVDITSGGIIRVYGTIEASGGRGGNGGVGGYGNYLGGGGGGGGSGGGVRLLTPNDIDVTGGTVSAAGGAGGTGGLGSFSIAGAQRNNGGVGGSGRIVMEDSDSVITGLGSATVAPGEGQDGFYRAKFDATRFQGGGLDPVAVTGLMFLGPISPVTFLSATAADFVAGIPSVSSRGNGKASILVEAQGYPLRYDGLPDELNPSGWYSVGYFQSGVAGPQWVPDSNPSPGDVTIASNNEGAGVANLNGSGFVQLRISFWLPGTIGATDPGPYIDRYVIRFSFDQ